MKRKVIQINPTTLAVTLPKKWTEANKIKKGDELLIHEDPKNLVLSQIKDGGISDIVTIDLTKLGVFEKNFISTLYQAGVDEIKVIYKDKKIIPIIQRHINQYCIGFDIVEQTNTYVIIRSITTDIIIEFEKMYKKNIQIMIQMMSEIADAVKNNDIANISNTRHLEESENKIQCLCLRYVSKKGFPMNPKRERAAYDLIREIENICDCMKRICDLLNKPIIFSKTTVNYTKEVESYVHNFYDMYYNPNEKNMKYFWKDGKNIVEKGYKLFGKLSQKELLLIHHLIDIVNRTYFLSHPYFEIAN